MGASLSLDDRLREFTKDGFRYLTRVDELGGSADLSDPLPIEKLRWDRERGLFVGASAIFATGCERFLVLIAINRFRVLQTTGPFICRNSGGKWRRRVTCGCGELACSR